MKHQIHKVKFEAKNSSGKQTLYIDINHPSYDKNVTCLTLVGKYRGKDIQIDFKEISNNDFKKTLKFLISQLENEN